MFSRAIKPEPETTGKVDPSNEPAKDDEEEEEGSSSTEDLFKEDKVRSKFVRHVYAILSGQLLFTVLVVLIFLYVDAVQETVYDYPQVVFVCLAIMLVPYLILLCCEDLRRRFPTNIVLLSIMTIGTSGVCGSLSATYDTEVFLYALLLTMFVTVSISLLAVCCPIDFTKYCMVACGSSLILSIIGVSFLIITESSHVKILCSVIFAVIFSLFLLLDTSAIMGGRRISLDPDEYVLGTVQLYVDIVEVFLNCLEMVGTCSEKDK